MRAGRVLALDDVEEARELAFGVGAEGLGGIGDDRHPAAEACRAAAHLAQGQDHRPAGDQGALGDVDDEAARPRVEALVEVPGHLEDLVEGDGPDDRHALRRVAVERVAPHAGGFRGVLVQPAALGLCMRGAPAPVGSMIQPSHGGLSQGRVLLGDDPGAESCAIALLPVPYRYEDPTQDHAHDAIRRIVTKSTRLPPYPQGDGPQNSERISVSAEVMARASSRPVALCASTSTASVRSCASRPCAAGSSVPSSRASWRTSGRSRQARARTSAWVTEDSTPSPTRGRRSPTAPWPCVPSVTGSRGVAHADTSSA